MELVLKSTPLAVSVGMVESLRVNTKYLGFSIEVLKDKKRFKDVGSE